MEKWLLQQGSFETAATEMICLMHRKMKLKLSYTTILRSESVMFQLPVPTKGKIVEELVTQRCSLATTVSVKQDCSGVLLHAVRSSENAE